MRVLLNFHKTLFLISCFFMIKCIINIKMCNIFNSNQDESQLQSSANPVLDSILKHVAILLNNDRHQTHMFYTSHNPLQHRTELRAKLDSKNKRIYWYWFILCRKHDYNIILICNNYYKLSMQTLKRLKKELSINGYFTFCIVII